MDGCSEHAALDGEIFAGPAWCWRRLAGRLAVFLAALLVCHGAEAETAPARGFSNHSPAEAIQWGLGGASVTVVTVGVFAEAVKNAVAANPRQAAAILTAALSVERQDSALIAGRLTGAAITGLGPAAREAMVTALVQIGVGLQPSAVLFIVRAAVRAAPEPLAQAVVRAAVAALKNPPDNLIARINEVARTARLGTDDDESGLALEPGLEAVGELDQGPMLTGGLGTIPPLSPNNTPTPAPRRTPVPGPPPSL